MPDPEDTWAREVPMTFIDRMDAGRSLAEKLASHAGEDVVVLALPRGGVPVAFEVARALDAPLDVWVARKLGVPAQPELGMGAIAEGGGLYLNRSVLQAAEVTQGELDAVIAREQRELARRVGRFRGERAAPEVQGKTVILVDDGLATGSTARAAIDALRGQDPGRLVLAVPVAPRDVVGEFAREVDEVVAVESPIAMWSVGGFYQDFRQTTDDEVVRFLEVARERRPSGDRGASSPPPP